MTIGVHTAGHGCGGAPQGDGRHVHAPALVQDRSGLRVRAGFFPKRRYPLVPTSKVTGGASAPSFSRRRDAPIVRAARPFDTKGLINLRRRRALCPSSLGGLGATLSRRSRDDRASHFDDLHQVCQDRADAGHFVPSLHQCRLPFTPQDLARGGTDDVQDFTTRGSTHDH